MTSFTILRIVMFYVTFGTIKLNSLFQHFSSFNTSCSFLTLTSTVYFFVTMTSSTYYSTAVAKRINGQMSYNFLLAVFKFYILNICQGEDKNQYQSTHFQDGSEGVSRSEVCFALFYHCFFSKFIRVVWSGGLTYNLLAEVSKLY